MENKNVIVSDIVDPRSGCMFKAADLGLHCIEILIFRM